MKNKTVSIVIPTFNRADYLKQCIDSCLDQTYSCEIIVCDHGSSDNTPSIAKSYGDRITYIRREKDLGIHFCWLEGILSASGDLIHLNFDDDWILPDFIEKCINLLNEDMGMVITEYSLFDDTKKSITHSNCIFSNNITTGIYDSQKFLKKIEYSLISPGCILFRKKILVDYLFVGNVPFAETHYKGVGPDLLFLLFSGLIYPKVGYINENLAIFRAHSNSITINAGSDTIKQKQISFAYHHSKDIYIYSKYLKKFKLDWLLKKIFYLEIRLNRIFKTKL